MKSVELHQAHVWTCEECGRDQFERCVTVSPEAAQDLVESGEAYQVGEGAWVTAPTRVICKACGSRFEAVDPREA